MEAAGSSGEQSAAAKRAERMDRLRNLHLKRNEARKMNHAEVVEEDKRKKLPTNFETKRKRVEWEEQQDQLRKDCESSGKDFDRVKLLEVGADEAERYEKKKKKRNPDGGFADYEQATFRQYSRLSRQMKPNPEEYAHEKNKLGKAFYPSVDTLGTTEHTDTKESIDRMVDDLEQQIEKRSKYSRRRTHDEEADIDYINERNMKFNKKLERFYGSYTSEIKQNLERGTAV
ncbi:hypothetical protein CAPTEDRAFT_20848 [Capitella teleta]|uniref:Pre-mRNA-splicing factor SYF2 n=1 Tax=Capitella teleta TaxID=283909 RepID=R7UNX6_CAPTE|nr:hypothetical protein CAPTEDRAFT_20848 [Capitella teleta]|eukprot:ELU05061.1 hypothetical protein CAPTEDRAFT_20848 [Capitella teleta]